MNPAAGIGAELGVGGQGLALALFELFSGTGHLRRVSYANCRNFCYFFGSLLICKSGRFCLVYGVLSDYESKSTLASDEDDCFTRLEVGTDERYLDFSGFKCGKQAPCDLWKRING